MKKYILCAFLILLVGCAKAKPEDAVKGFMEAAKNYNIDGALKYVTDVESSKTTLYVDSDGVEYILDYIKENATKIEYAVDKSVIDKHAAVVTLNCKFIDYTPLARSLQAEYLKEAFSSAFTGGLSKEAATDLIKEIFLRLQSEYKDNFIEKNIQVNLTQKDKRWEIDTVDDNLANVVNSNLLSAKRELEDGYNSDKSKLTEIYNWVVGDIWNTGFCDIRDYISHGTSSTGETMDIDFTLDRLGKAMAKKKDYDSYISALGEEYADAKSVWGKLSAEIDILYADVVANKPKPNDVNRKFDTGLFVQYRDGFYDIVYK